MMTLRDGASAKTLEREILISPLCRLLYFTNWFLIRKFSFDKVSIVAVVSVELKKSYHKIDINH